MITFVTRTHISLFQAVKLAFCIATTVTSHERPYKGFWSAVNDDVAVDRYREFTPVADVEFRDSFGVLRDTQRDAQRDPEFLQTPVPYQVPA